MLTRANFEGGHITFAGQPQQQSYGLVSSSFAWPGIWWGRGPRRSRSSSFSSFFRGWGRGEGQEETLSWPFSRGGEGARSWAQEGEERPFRSQSPFPPRRKRRHWCSSHNWRSHNCQTCKKKYDKLGSFMWNTIGCCLH